jgi:hypothetical protein
MESGKTVKAKLSLQKCFAYSIVHKIAFHEGRGAL